MHPNVHTKLLPCSKTDFPSWGQEPIETAPTTHHPIITHEVNPDGGDVALRVGIIREPQQQTRLPHTRVTNQKQLEQVVTEGARDGFRRGKRERGRCGKLVYVGTAPVDTGAGMIS